jgi:putative nucleotidyltransferase with HDIG domain
VAPPKESKPSHSLFNQRLDRAVLATYFLGGIAPIGALGWVVHHYVMPAEEDLLAFGWLAGVMFLGVLSLGVSLALRRITRNAVEQMDADNQGLQTMLDASSELAAETHADVVLGRLAVHAGAVSPSGTPVILHAPLGDKALEAVGHDGTVRDELLALAEEAIGEGQPAVGSGAAAGRIAVPFGVVGGDRGAILVPESMNGQALDALTTVARMAGTAIQRGVLQDTQRNFFVHVTDLIVSALDAHVVGREGHANQTARTANRIGRTLGLDDAQMEQLHFGALLHDIGMLKIAPEHHMDLRAVRSHALIGARMLQRIRLWESVAPIVLHHHEWFDGTGYPEGKIGTDIPLEARIMAVADAADAMVRSDGDRPGMSVEDIVREVQAGRGSQFDPDVVDAFAGLAERGELEL